MDALSTPYIARHPTVLGSLKKPQLVSLAKEAGLVARGNKSDIIGRLQAWAQDQAGDSLQAPIQPTKLAGGSEDVDELEASVQYEDAVDKMQPEAQDYFGDVDNPFSIRDVVYPTNTQDCPVSMTLLGDAFDVPESSDCVETSSTSMESGASQESNLGIMPATSQALTVDVKNDMRFIFGTPAPQQSTALVQAGGSMWDPVPDEAVDDTQAQATSDASNASKESTSAVDDVWAELRARSGVSTGLGITGVAVATSSSITVQNSSSSRYGEAHTKEFEKMNSIATHYTAKRKVSPVATTEFGANSDAPAATQDAKRRKLALTSTATQVPKASANQVDVARGKRAMEVAKARRKSGAGRRSLGGGAGYRQVGPVGRSNAGGIGKRLMKTAANSIRNLTKSSSVQADSKLSTTTQPKMWVSKYTGASAPRLDVRDSDKTHLASKTVGPQDLKGRHQVIKKQPVWLNGTPPAVKTRSMMKLCAVGEAIPKLEFNKEPRSFRPPLTELNKENQHVQTNFIDQSTLGKDGEGKKPPRVHFGRPSQLIASSPLKPSKSPNRLQTTCTVPATVATISRFHVTPPVLHQESPTKSNHQQRIVPARGVAKKRSETMTMLKKVGKGTFSSQFYSRPTIASSNKVKGGVDKSPKKPMSSLGQSIRR